MMVTPDNTSTKKIKFAGGKDESLALKKQIADFTDMAKRQKKLYEES
jgi:hypothetical protein